MNEMEAKGIGVNDRNCLPAVRFRQGILMMQSFMEEVDRLGLLYTKPDQYPLTHHFTPIDKDLGCCLYARQVVLDKGHLIIGHIHNRPHINLLLAGKILVATETGRSYQQAPFVAAHNTVGVKKAIYVEEEAVLVTVCLSRYSGEENLPDVERDIFAKMYEDLGLASSVEDLKELENQLWPE